MQHRPERQSHNREADPRHVERARTGSELHAVTHDSSYLVESEIRQAGWIADTAVRGPGKFR